MKTDMNKKQKNTRTFLIKLLMVEKLVLNIGFNNSFVTIIL